MTRVEPDDELGRFRLDERVAIVTGATGGIGSRLAEALSRVGARVSSTDATRRAPRPRPSG